MRRRVFLVGAAQAGTAYLISAAARAEWPTRDRPARIGTLFVNHADSPLYQAFFAALRERGLIEGENIVLVRRFAGGRLDLLPQLATELVAANVDLIVTSSSQAVSAAKGATATIPIVAAIIGDPVAEGLGTNLAHPTGNVTGGSLIGSEVIEKRLELFKATVPTMSRVAVFTDESYGEAGVPRTAVAQSLGVEMRVVKVAAGDFEQAFANAAAMSAQGLLAEASVAFNSADVRKRLAVLSLRYRLPGSFHEVAFVRDGGLMSYGPDFAEMFRHAAVYTEKILSGAKPADLPFEQPTKFILAINLRTAKALGLTIPPSILARADEVIE